MTPDIARNWGLSFDDLLFLAELPEDVRLEAALQFCHLVRTGPFAEDWTCISDDALLYVASQVSNLTTARIALSMIGLHLDIGSNSLNIWVCHGLQRMILRPWKLGR